jgi:hypothetical protein
MVVRKAGASQFVPGEFVTVPPPNCPFVFNVVSLVAAFVTVVSISHSSPVVTAEPGIGKSGPPAYLRTWPAMATGFRERLIPPVNFVVVPVECVCVIETVSLNPQVGESAQ